MNISWGWVLIFSKWAQGHSLYQLFCNLDQHIQVFYIIIAKKDLSAFSCLLICRYRQWLNPNCIQDLFLYFLLDNMGYEREIRFKLVLFDILVTILSSFFINLASIDLQLRLDFLLFIARLFMFILFLNCYQSQKWMLKYHTDMMY